MEGAGKGITYVLQTQLSSGQGETSFSDKHIYFIPSSESNAYRKQIKVILSAVKKYRIFSLVMNTIYIFSL